MKNHRTSYRLFPHQTQSLRTFSEPLLTTIDDTITIKFDIFSLYMLFIFLHIYKNNEKKSKNVTIYETNTNSRKI